MDPNAALEQIRWLIDDMMAADKLDDERESERLAALIGSQLVDLIDGLDTWIRRGGSLPDAWKR